MEELLRQAGLNELQSRAYLYLMKYGEASPPQIAKDLDITRSNAYKLLDKLVALGLIVKVVVNNKFIYRPEDPVALSAIVAAERNRLTILERDLKSTIQELRLTYNKNAGKDFIVVHKGVETIKKLRDSISKSNDIRIETEHIVWIVSNKTLFIISDGSDSVAVQISNKAIAEGFTKLSKRIDNLQP